MTIIASPIQRILSIGLTRIHSENDIKE